MESTLPDQKSTLPERKSTSPDRFRIEIDFAQSTHINTDQPLHPEEICDQTNSLWMDETHFTATRHEKKKRIYLSLSCLKMEKTLIRKGTLKDIIAQL